MRCGHLNYDTWIWLKITSLSSTASVLNGCKKIFAKESLNVPNVTVLSLNVALILALFLLEAVEAMDVTFNQIQVS